jgi:hypothetical protein
MSQSAIGGQNGTTLPDEPNFAPPISQEEIALRLRAYHTLLIQKFGAWRPVYNDLVTQANAEDKENDEAAHRMRAAIDWLVSRAEEGKISTLIRRADTREKPAPFSSAPDGFWTTSNPIGERLGTGYVRLRWNADTRLVQTKALDYLVYFDRMSLERSLFESVGRKRDGQPGPDLTKFPIVAFLVQASNEVPAELLGESKKPELTDWIFRRAPAYLDVSLNQAGYMATFLRPLRAQKGGAKKQKKL